ncbi:MAG: hypothetical protein Q7T61_16140 [Caulobacter sp.]|nr:hypothetical protein [Caulobacter sp.]
MLTPLLALFLLLDITSFWLFAWDQRETLRVGYVSLFVGLGVAGTYYLAASMVFPNRDDDWPSLEDHYWARKRWVLGGVLLINAATIAAAVVARPPAWNDWLFYLWQLTYFVPLVVLLFSRRRGLDLVLLSISILFYLASTVGVLPESHWASSSVL